MKSTVIITVPHAKCPQFKVPTTTTTTIHPCDTLSEKAASILHKSLTDNNIENFLFIGDIPRTKNDLNRERSRETTDYRLKLTKKMSAKKQNIVAVLDVHSYPSSGSTFPSDSEVVILDSASGSPKQYSTNLYNDLRGSGVKAYLIAGSEVNDIEREARTVHGLRAVLIEFNEALSDDRLEKISNVIAKWVLLLLK